MTSVSKEDPWFQAFTRATDKHQLKVEPRIFPAGTDSRYIREIGIPAFGFSPMNFTPVCIFLVITVVIYFLVFFTIDLVQGADVSNHVTVANIDHIFQIMLIVQSNFSFTMKE
jgi:hypothetical protein